MVRRCKEGAIESEEVDKGTDNRCAQEGTAGAKVPDLCRKYGMSDASDYSCKAKHAGVTGSDLRCLKALEAENRLPMQIVAEQALDGLTIKELLSRNFERPRPEKRQSTMA